MRRATFQFRWKILQISVLQYDKLTAWLDLQYFTNYIELYEARHPPVQMENTTN